MAQYDNDIKYHSEKAKLYGHLQNAVRGYLSNNVMTLSPGDIISLAKELRSYEIRQNSEVRNVDRYAALQAEATALENGLVIQAQETQTDEEVSA